MLVAQTKNGEWINLVEKQNPIMLKAMKQVEEFVCPGCRKNVILKIGTKRITHFAHKQGTACTVDYERESEYHLKGKILLYEWVKAQKIKPLLEPYLKDIQQRPDIAFSYDGIDFVIEYQCSSISKELFIKRTNQYLKANIRPIWIMAGKNIKRKSDKQISLSQFDYLFLMKNTANNWMISSFCPITEIFIINHPIIPLTVQKAFTQFSPKKLSSFKVSDLLLKNQTFPFKLQSWQHEIRKIKNLGSVGYGMFPRKFLAELYVHSILLAYLPPEIGLPVPHAPIIETPPIQWQCYLFIDLLSRKRSFSEKEAISSFHQRIRKGDIKMRLLPLYPKGDSERAIKEYIHLLVKVNILRQTSEDRFQICNPIHCGENQQQQLEKEDEFYQQYGKSILQFLKSESLM